MSVRSFIYVNNESQSSSSSGEDEDTIVAANNRQLAVFGMNGHGHDHGVDLESGSNISSPLYDPVVPRNLSSKSRSLSNTTKLNESHENEEHEEEITL